MDQEHNKEHDQEHNQEHKKEIFIYFVDNVKYETDQSALTGAQIKAKIPNFNSTYALFLEGHGNEKDILVTDDSSISLKKEKEPCRFYLVPPATFGK
jgi:hypothetical protein